LVISETMNESRPNIFFRFVVIAGFIFVVTILALIAGILGDGRAPVHQWLNRNGMILIVAEVAVIGITGLLALVIDRWRTLREKPRSSSKNP
jgi:hypothetical protein